MGCFGAEPPHRIDVPPRALTPEERALADVLMASPIAAPEVRAQVATAKVVGICSCGCRSIFLEPAEDAPKAYPHAGRAIEIVANGRGVGADEWGEISVTLHIVAGQIQELEIWGGTRDGTNGGSLPEPSGLRL